MAFTMSWLNHTLMKKDRTVENSLGFLCLSEIKK